MTNSSSSYNSARIRIDKWLWAARFFKTRGIAKQAIEGGKVQVDGQRAKPSKEIEVGAIIRLRQGFPAWRGNIFVPVFQHQEQDLLQQKGSHSSSGGAEFHWHCVDDVQI